MPLSTPVRRYIDGGHIDHQIVQGQAMAHGHEHSHGHEYEPDHEHGEDHDELQHCIEECLNCHAVCTMTVQYCLTEGGDHADVNMIGVLLDCAEICQTSANFMLRGSPHHVVTCLACAELCRACEEACRSISGDERMTHCAEICAACAESCERMANGGASGSDEVAED